MPKPLGFRGVLLRAPALEGVAGVWGDDGLPEGEVEQRCWRVG
jgi:hypothetical protein